MHYKYLYSYFQNPKLIQLISSLKYLNLFRLTKKILPTNPSFKQSEAE